MYSKWHLAGKYFNYYLTASNGRGHGTHSPFIFHFITKVLNDKLQYPEYTIVENLRSRLLEDKTVLTVEDFGAGSSLGNSSKKTVAAIAKNSAKRKKFGQLLFRIVKEYQPATILELGTSLGITTSYMSLAKPCAKLVTMEGAGEVADRSAQNFKELRIGNIEIARGNFDTTFTQVVNGLSSVDFAFIDGNHRREPTERYFRGLLPAVKNDSILVFDDIHWSPEMELAWETIKAHSAVRCSIDLFFMGVIFFRNEFREKQHFRIRF